MMTNAIKILLVEDNRIAQTTSCLILKHLGYHVDLATSGKQAVELFKPDFYSLIYLDLGLPDVKGCELLKTLRALDKASKVKTNIIILTAHSDTTLDQACCEAGSDAVLTKPLLLKSASQMVEKFIYHHDVVVEGLRVPDSPYSDLDK